MENAPVPLHRPMAESEVSEVENAAAWRCGGVDPTPKMLGPPTSHQKPTLVVGWW